MSNNNESPKNENKIKIFEGNTIKKESNLKLKKNLKHELNNTEPVDENDCYESEITTEGYKN